MATTTTVQETLQTILSKANPQEIADALRQVDLGKLLASEEYDTGAFTPAVASIVLPFEAAIVQSVRIVTATTAGYVGTYAVGDSGVTKLSAAASSVVGLCALGTDRKTITFLAGTDALRVLVRYSRISTPLATAVPAA